jgi:hypothetical protein
VADGDPLPIGGGAHRADVSDSLGGDTGAGTFALQWETLDSESRIIDTFVKRFDAASTRIVTFMEDAFDRLIAQKAESVISAIVNLRDGELAGRVAAGARADDGFSALWPRPIDGVRWCSMVKIPYKVYAVVDREFGEQLAALESGVPVWIVKTPLNLLVAERLWNKGNPSHHLTGITVFNDCASMSPEQLFLGELGTIDLHHGDYSSDPPYTILEVLGAQLTEAVKAALIEFGFNELHPGASGFSASRPLPQREGVG